MERKAIIKRNTRETEIELALDLSGGEITVDTGIGFLDHMLTALFFYASFGAELKAAGDVHVDAHHTVEDTGIVIGQALKEAAGDKKGIRRFGSAFVPMDESLGHAAVDMGGRPYLVFQADMPQDVIGSYDACLTEEFMCALATHAGMTLHLRSLYGKNAHHITEGLFKSAGLALKEALKIEGEGVTSTKGVLE